MTLAEKLARGIGRAERDPNYWKDIAITDFTGDLHARMTKLKISQGKLARLLGTSRPNITKLLSGSNFTLLTMVRLAMALNAVVRVRLEGREERSKKHAVAAAVADGGRELTDMAEWRKRVRLQERGNNVLGGLSRPQVRRGEQFK